MKDFVKIGFGLALGVALGTNVGNLINRCMNRLTLRGVSTIVASDEEYMEKLRAKDPIAYERIIMDKFDW